MACSFIGKYIYKPIGYAITQYSISICFDTAYNEWVNTFSQSFLISSDSPYAISAYTHWTGLTENVVNIVD